MTFNLQTYNQEMEEEFQKIECTYYPSGMPENYLKPQQRKDIKEFIISSNTKLLKQFLEEEVERLKVEKAKRCDKKDCLQAYCLNRKIRNETIKDQITHYQSLLNTLGDN